MVNGQIPDTYIEQCICRRIETLKARLLKTCWPLPIFAHLFWYLPLVFDQFFQGGLLTFTACDKRSRGPSSSLLRALLSINSIDHPGRQAINSSDHTVPSMTPSINQASKQTNEQPKQSITQPLTVTASQSINQSINQIKSNQSVALL